MWQYNDYSELYHYGVKGMKWGKRSRKRIYAGPGVSVQTGSRVDGGPAKPKKKQDRETTENEYIEDANFPTPDTIKEIRKRSLESGRVYTYRKSKDAEAGDYGHYNVSTPFANPHAGERTTLDDEFSEYVTSLTGAPTFIIPPQEATVLGPDKVHRRLQKEQTRKERENKTLEPKRAATKKRIENAQSKTQKALKKIGNMKLQTK